MANELTPNLGIEMPDVNDDENTWGDILREAMLAFDEAIAGRVTLSTSQTITGYKRFTGGLSLGTGPGSLNFGMVGARTYFAPRLANNSDWDWSSEFGYDGSKWYAEGPAAVTGEFGALRIRLSSTADVTGTSTDHAFQIGPSNGLNLRIDQNEVAAYSDGQPSALHLNPDGGDVIVGLSYKAWHAGNDGVGSGLDADLLDGQQGSYYTNIVARLGYTPMNAAGGTFTGAVVAAEGLVTGSGAGRLNINSSGARSYFAPRNSNNSDWDWNKEFGYDSSVGRWYVDSGLNVTGSISTDQMIYSGASRTENAYIGSGPGSLTIGRSGTRSYIAPRNSSDTDWDWSSEFGYSTDSGGFWYFEDELRVNRRVIAADEGYRFSGDNNSGMRRDAGGGVFIKVGPDDVARFSWINDGNHQIATASKTGADTSPGFIATSHGTLVSLRNSGWSGKFGRANVSDGDVLYWMRNATAQGVVSVSGSTVAYGSFCGSHWSQLDQGIIDIPRGTVLSTIDQKCEWYFLEYTTVGPDGEPSLWRDIYFGTEPVGAQVAATRDGQTVPAIVGREDNDQLMMTKVSDVENDRRVYGVFDQWDQDGDATVHGLGATMIRVTGPCEGGDLLASRGDGTAMVQADDIVRSYTIGKVTMGFPDAGADEENLVPCVLYCG